MHDLRPNLGDRRSGMPLKIGQPNPIPPMIVHASISTIPLQHCDIATKWSHQRGMLSPWCTGNCLDRCGSPRSRCDRDLMIEKYWRKKTSREVGKGTLAKGDFVEDFAGQGREAFEHRVKSWAQSRPTGETIPEWSPVLATAACEAFMKKLLCPRILYSRNLYKTL